MSKPNTCPTPSKARYRDLRDASKATASFVRVLNQEGRIAQDMYAYQCRCGHYHLTKWASYRGERLELAGAAPAESLQRWAITGRLEGATFAR